MHNAIISFHSGPNDVIPKHGVHEVEYDNEDDGDNSMAYFDDVNDSHGHNYNTKSGTTFSGFGSTIRRGVTVKKRMLSREKKRVREL